MSGNPSDILRGIPGYSPQSNRVSPDSTQRLTNAGIGTVASLPARFFDQINSGPAPAGTRQNALDEVRRLLENDAGAIYLAEAIAMGVRTALASSGSLQFDPNVVWANAKAFPVDLSFRGVVVPPNPTAAQTAAANLLELANRNPTTLALGDDPFEDFVRIEGNGSAIDFDVEAGWVAVIDEIGITTFSAQAEDELLWTLGMGFAAITSDAPQNPAELLVPTRRGWPFGDVVSPGKLNGRARISNQSGSPSNTVRVSMRVAHDAAAGAASTPHYFEGVLRAWKVQMGRDNRPVSTGLGGADAGWPSPERT